MTDAVPAGTEWYLATQSCVTCGEQVIIPRDYFGPAKHPECPSP